MSAQQMLLALQARWRLAAVVALQGALLGAAIGLALPWQYSATAELLLHAGQPNWPPEDQQLPKTLAISDCAAMLGSETVALTAARSLISDRSVLRDVDWVEAARHHADPAPWLAGRLMSQLSVQFMQGSNVLRAQVRDGDPVQAAGMVNAVVAAYAAIVEADAPMAGMPVRVTVLRPARPVADSRWEYTGWLAGFGLLTGVVLAFAGVLLLETRAPRLRAEADVMRLLALPMLGCVPTQRTGLTPASRRRAVLREDKSVPELAWPALKRNSP